METIRKLLTYLWPKGKFSLRLRIICAICCLIMSKCVNVYVPIFYKKAIDALDVSPGVLTYTSLPILLILAYGGARIGAQVFNELKDAFTARVEQNAMREIALQVFRHLHNLSLRFHLERRTGGLSRVIERGVKAMETVLRYILFNLVPIMVEMLFVCVVLWKMYDIRYMAITLGVTCTYILATVLMTRWRISYVRRMQKADATANSVAIDSLLNYETVKYFGNEDHELARYDHSLREYQDGAIQSKYSLSTLNVTQGLIIGGGLIILMTMAAFDVGAGVMTLGDLVLVNTYLIQLYLPLNILGFAVREIKLSSANMEDMFSLLQQPIEVQSPKDAPQSPPDHYEIRFEDVDFGYHADRQILKGVSLCVPSGTTTAIVGESGAGKSTISRLLFRFYDVLGGTVRIGGRDVRQIPLDVLRAQIAVVPQDTVLFNETIYYNISYGHLEADPEKVFEAAKLAQIHDFILSLPQGYDTMVGERGLKLSGGEKQRVAIARALLKNPEIFIFDEATSSLDTETEKQIQLSINQVAKRHTAVIIAHRLSTVVEADQIVVLRNGRVVERGTHQELLARGGYYRQLWQKQEAQREP